MSGKMRWPVHVRDVVEDRSEQLIGANSIVGDFTRRATSRRSVMSSRLFITPGLAEVCRLSHLSTLFTGDADSDPVRRSEEIHGRRVSREHGPIGARPDPRAEPPAAQSAKARASRRTPPGRVHVARSRLAWWFDARSCGLALHGRILCEHHRPPDDSYAGSVAEFLEQLLQLDAGPRGTPRPAFRTARWRIRRSACGDSTGRAQPADLWPGAPTPFRVR